MPKMKTHSGAKKRFGRTKKGKLYSSHTSDMHEQTRRRRGHPKQGLAKGQAKKISKLFGA